jgi:helicase SWR1
MDGSTRPEVRQKLTERFNQDPRIFVFILSTRSGGCVSLYIDFIFVHTE